MELHEPQSHTFETIIGQDLVKRFLRRASDAGRLPQGILFSGPDGVGKRPLMYALAKHLVTQHLEPGSEEARRAEGKVERGAHPDVLIIEPKSSSGQILTGQVDEMEERAAFAPLESPVRVIGIAPVEAMNRFAANHLLKLLEEPPPALRILLCCEQTHLVLSTIRSRCAILRCPPVETEALVQWLHEVGRLPLRRAETAAQLAGGRPGVAMDLASGENQERRRRLCGELEFLQRAGYPSIFRVGGNVLEITGSTHEAFNTLLFWFRDLMVARLCAESAGGDDGQALDPDALPEHLLVNRDLLEELAAGAAPWSADGLARAIERILERFPDADRPFVDPGLLMTNLLTDLGVALKT